MIWHSWHSCLRQSHLFESLSSLAMTVDQQDQIRGSVARCSSDLSRAEKGDFEGSVFIRAITSEAMWDFATLYKALRKRGEKRKGWGRWNDRESNLMWSLQWGHFNLRFKDRLRPRCTHCSPLSCFTRWSLLKGKQVNCQFCVCWIYKSLEPPVFFSMIWTRWM